MKRDEDRIIIYIKYIFLTENEMIRFEKNNKEIKFIKNLSYIKI